MYPKIEKKRITELDALRGIAALSVLLFHYTTRFSQMFGYDYIVKYFEFSYGHYGVTLFFIISGFVIFMTVNKVKSPADFVVRRFIRLYPAFWICVSLTFVVVSLLNISSLKVSNLDFIMNLTMIPKMLGFEFVDGAYWTLEIELCFYVLMLGLIIFRLTRKMVIIGIAYLIIVYLSLYFYRYTTMVFYSTLFLAGINFYKLWSHAKNKYVWHTQILLCFIFTLFSHNLSLIISTAIFYGLFYLFIYGKLRFLNIPILFYLGEISYVLYLIHQYIGYSIQVKLIEVLHVNNPFILFFTPFILSFLVASFIVYKIDMPLRKVLLNKWRQEVKV